VPRHLPHIYTYTFTYMYMYRYVHTFKCIVTHVYKCVYTCFVDLRQVPGHVCQDTCRICIYTYMYICTYVYICIDMYIFKCIFTHVYKCGYTCFVDLGQVPENGFQDTYMYGYIYIYAYMSRCAYRYTCIFTHKNVYIHGLLTWGRRLGVCAKTPAACMYIHIYI